MNPALQPFLTVALPIIVTLALGMWTNNGCLADLRKDMDRRFGEIIARLDRIERKLDNHEERIVRLKERTSPIHR